MMKKKVSGTDYLIDSINNVIDYGRMEFDLTYPAIIGCLEMIKLEILLESMGIDIEDDDEEDDDV